MVSAAEKLHPDGIWRSSENFITFKQKLDTHQLVVSATTGEVIFLIPSLNHQLETLPPDLEERVKETLRKSLKMKNNQVKKSSKRRKSFAKKCFFWGKCVQKVFILPNLLKTNFTNIAVLSSHLGHY